MTPDKISIDAAKQLHSLPWITPELKSALENDFPELKESADERIRKHIIEILERLSACHFDGNEKSECIAYLERQKEWTPEIINITEMVAKYRATDEYVEGEYKGKPVNCMIRAYEQGIRDTLLKAKEPHTVSIKDATKFGNLEYQRGVKDGIQGEKNRQWKPSEEQMEALRKVAYKMGNSCFGERWANDKNLHSLYVALQKLLSL